MGDEKGEKAHSFPESALEEARARMWLDSTLMCKTAPSGTVSFHPETSQYARDSTRCAAGDARLLTATTLWAAGNISPFEIDLKSCNSVGSEKEAGLLERKVRMVEET